MSAKKKPALPDPPKPGENPHNFNARMKELLEILTGRRGGKIAKLKTGATQEEIIAKINELIDHLM